ncbi:MAG: hypothetical protein QXD61_10930 [Candidatus Caldarchaeum sp.]
MKLKSIINDVRDLVSMFYGNQIDAQKRKKYDDYCANMFAEKAEQDVERVFSALGNIRKIKEEKQRKTPDYVIDSAKMVIEIKSVSDVEIPLRILTERHVEQYVDEALLKDYSPYSGYYKGVVIVVPRLPLVLSEDVLNRLKNSFKQVYVNRKGKIDFIALLPRQDYIDNEPFGKISTLYIWCSDEHLAEKFRKVDGVEIDPC